MVDTYIDAILREKKLLSVNSQIDCVEIPYLPNRMTIDL